MKLCDSCHKQHNDTHRLCQACLDKTAEKELVKTTSTYQNTPASPISPITDNILYSRYEIIKPVGQGDRGKVYLAKDLCLNGKEVAIKEVLLNSTESEEFINEVKILVQLEHPNLPKITDYYPPNEFGQTYIVMDYIKGDTLSHIFERKNYVLPIEQIMKYAIQLCDLLDYLHSHNPPIIYRDLRPSNIMIDNKDNVQLINLGIALKHQEGKQDDTILQGTEIFAAPEQFMINQQIDHRTDLYSFGATLYYLLTGGRYFLLQKKTIEQLNTKLIHELCNIVNKLLEYQPEKRYQSAKELKSALTSLKSFENTKEIPETAKCDDIEKPTVSEVEHEQPVHKIQKKVKKSKSLTILPVLFFFFVPFMIGVIAFLFRDDSMTMTTELQETLFSIGNEHIQSDVEATMQDDRPSDDFHSFLLIEYDLDTLELSDYEDGEYLASVNVQFDYEETHQTDEENEPMPYGYSGVQKLVFCYDEIDEWTFLDYDILYYDETSSFENVAEYTFWNNPMTLTTELQDYLFSVGNEYIKSAVAAYQTNDFSALKHVTSDVINIYDEYFFEYDGPLELVQYDLDTLELYKNENEQDEVSVNVWFECETTYEVQTLTFLYNKNNQWVITDYYNPADDEISSFENVAEYTF